MRLFLLDVGKDYQNEANVVLTLSTEDGIVQVKKRKKKKITKEVKMTIRGYLIRQ